MTIIIVWIPSEDLFLSLFKDFFLLFKTFSSQKNCLSYEKLFIVEKNFFSLNKTHRNFTQKFLTHSTRSTSLPLSHYRSRHYRSVITAQRLYRSRLYRSRHYRSEPLPLESLPLQIFQIFKFLKIHLLKLIYVMLRLDQVYVGLGQVYVGLSQVYAGLGNFNNHLH